jgi:hypothetical protein
MKTPLFIAAAFIVVRIIVELLGASESINNIFGVAWLYFLVPIYFALQITKAGDASPFKTLLKDTVLYAFYTRLMVMVTYWLAYMFEWSAPRFSVDLGGVVGSGSNLVWGDFPNGMNALYGILIIPVTNVVFWVISATIVGLITGGITLLVRRSKTKATA